ncbi:MAG: ATP-binding protein [Spirosomataceae bacterium]
MANFDFSTLSSSDLEELVCSLLNAKEQSTNSNIVFRTFKDGKDKGIDILYSTAAEEYEIVGQVKHYYRSGYHALVAHLKSSEKQKVHKLAPRRYFLATSVDLSVANVIEIKGIFQPYLQSLSDVYGKKDLNRDLDLFPGIVNQQFKLWYSTTEILRRILNYQMVGRSYEFQENQLKKRLRLYVETPALTEARGVLEKNNFIIITGEPGVGKTSAAEILLYEYIKEGYQLTYIYDDIKEAEKILDEREKIIKSEVEKEIAEKEVSKHIFYFDDFLGHNSAEIQKAKGSETALLKILRRISLSENIKFIFTTRTFILRSAVEESENLRRFNLRANESIVKLDMYSVSVRRQLLINHTYESDLSEDCKQILAKSNVQDFIINHANFSPRSVEFITSKENTKGLSAVEYERFIYKNFNKPDEIWRHAYEQQITDIDRMLLNTMVSFGDSVDIGDLELAYKARIDYEVKLALLHGSRSMAV